MGQATVFFGDDVIDVKGKLRAVCREVAILASTVGTMNHLGFKCAIGTSHAL
jgi:hypothetical protein